MWKYKVVRLDPKEYQQWNVFASNTESELKSTVRSRIEQASGKKQLRIISEEYHTVLINRIREKFSILKHKEFELFPEKNWESSIRYTTTPEEYLEIKLNQYAEEGWELDKTRFRQPTSYTEGILILRRLMDSHSLGYWNPQRVLG